MMNIYKHLPYSSHSIIVLLPFCQPTHPLGHAHQLCAVNLGHAPSAGKKVEILPFVQRGDFERLWGVLYII
jgi:hypothetical protein